MSTPAGALYVLAQAGARLSGAFAGVLLPPRASGKAVAVTTGPPVSAAGLPAAWCELAGGGGADQLLVEAVVRYVIVPAPAENDSLEDTVATIVDTLEATKLPGRWRWSRQAVQIDNVDRDAVVFDVPVTYPSTC